MPTSQIPQSLLVIDDDEVFRGLLHALLTAEGYTLTLAASGDEALQLLRGGHRFDLILSDIQMPELEGDALATTLRQTMPPGALLIGMSASEPPPGTQKLFDSFLLKPFQVQLLRDAIDEAETRKRAGDHQTQHQRLLDAAVPCSLMTPLDNKIFHSLLAMISASKLRELFAMALIDIGKRHKRIEEAAAGGDLITVQREAHAIKGSCGMIGAKELHHLAASIEDGTTLNTSAIEEIPRACDRLQRMLDTQLHTV